MYLKCRAAGTQGRVCRTSIYLKYRAAGTLEASCYTIYHFYYRALRPRYKVRSGYNKRISCGSAGRIGAQKNPAQGRVFYIGWDGRI
ncbi:MAG: hypothetical protein LHW46_05160 [Candidatus Cloacimonetes bacterium]|nr:hypothetical protein [Candidatus Cloacimonadota bacterium]